MKKVLVCDWLDQYAGAERVIKVINEIIKPDEVYTMINVMSDNDLDLLGIERKNIEETFVRFFGTKFRYALPLFPLAAESISRKIPKNSLIISSSHALTKGVTSKGSLHICYLQARNMRYIWEESHRYTTGVKKVGKLFLRYLRNWDKKSAQVPDFLIANSRYVSNWAYEKYGRKSFVIYPPVEINKFKTEREKEDYYIYVGRLATLKRVDIIIKTFNELKKRLVIIGDGSEVQRLKSMAKSNVEFLGYQSSEAIARFLAKAKAFIMTNEEAFGITCIEAQACGTPVIAYGKGGATETVIDGKTGVLFTPQTVDGLKQGINRFLKLQNSFNPMTIRNNAERFSEEKFKKEFKQFVEEKCKKLK